MKKLKEKQVSKGTKKSVRKRYIRHKHFQKVLEDLEAIYIKQNKIQSIAHKVGTYNEERASLTGWDTKRFIRPCGIKTYAHGHFLTKYDDY